MICSGSYATLVGVGLDVAAAFASTEVDNGRMESGPGVSAQSLV